MHHHRAGYVIADYDDHGILRKTYGIFYSIIAHVFFLIKKKGNKIVYD